MVEIYIASQLHFQVHSSWLHGDLSPMIPNSCQVLSLCCFLTEELWPRGWGDSARTGVGGILNHDAPHQNVTLQTQKHSISCYSSSFQTQDKNTLWLKTI